MSPSILVNLRYSIYPVVKGDKHHSITPPADLSFHELLTQFTPQEFAFFAMLDEQLDKVDSFYLEREKEMISRGALLLNQLEELQEHQKMFLVRHFLPQFALLTSYD